MDKLMEIAGRIGSQKYLLAIRDSFATLMPVIMAGAIATLINNVPLNAEGTKTIGSVFSDIGLGFFRTTNGSIWWGTLAMMSLFIVFLVGFNLAKGLGGDPISAGIVSFAAYMSIIPQSPIANGGAAWGNISWAYTKADPLLVAIVLTCITTEIYCKLAKVNALVIKMPDGVPPAVSRGFAAMIPGALSLYAVVGIVSFIEVVILKTPELLDQGVVNNVFTLVNDTITGPLKSLTNTLPAALILVILTHLLWVIGLHGPNILGGIIDPLYMPAIDANMIAFQNQQEIPNIVTGPFLNAFVYLGGAGATLGLVIAIFMVSKSKALRTVGKISVGPGCFNINEPVIFGLPIIFNPIFAIPFIISPVVLTIISYFAMATGLVRKTVILTYWAMPPFLSGLVATGGDFRAPILQLINIVISVVIYIPFVKIVDNRELALEKQ